MREINYYGMKPAEQINKALAELPKAEMLDIQSVRGENNDQFEKIPHFKAIRVTEPKSNRVYYVGCPTKQYRLVQHEEAFRPIIEGLTLAGYEHFKFLIWSSPKKAQMQIYTTPEGYDSVNLGFSVTNSVDSNSCLRYGFEMNKASKYVEICGYRQVCSNGMKVRVPLTEAEIIREEEGLKIQELMKESTAIAHTAGIKAKMESMQYITEALAILAKPVERLIKRAQKFTIDNEKMLKTLIKAHVGSRYKRRVLDAYEQEKGDLWGLYNAITYVASHDPTLKESSRETLLNKAANMLSQEKLMPVLATE